MSSLGVVVPTKNSLKYLPDHLAGLRAWVDLAQEVVFVDSYSTDGTLEYIQQNFTHPGKRLVSHPPVSMPRGTMASSSLAPISVISRRWAIV
ncbi:MAG TPA: glycosyltransferase [Verrucomicrobiae bacterium]